MRVIYNLNNCLYSEYVDLNIYSRYYFNTVLRKMIFDYDYTLFYADFRELGIINNKLGVKTTDKLIGESLEKVLCVLPNNISVRIAGDEFLFIVPTSFLEKKNSEYIDDINTLLSKINYDEVIPYIDFVCANEKKNTFLNDTFKEVNEKMDCLKLKNKKKSLCKNDSVRNELSADFKTLFNVFRLDQIQNEENFNISLKSFYISLKDVYENLDDYIECAISYKNNHDFLRKFDWKKGFFYNQFHKAVESGNEAFFKKNAIIVDKISHKMVINNTTGYYNKLYYKNYFSRKYNNEKYYGLYLELVGLKSANVLLGHEQTDELLKKIYNFFNKNFSGKEVYCFDFLSGKSLILSKNKEDIDNESLKKSIDYINTSMFKKLELKFIYKPILKKSIPNDINCIVEQYENLRKEKEIARQKIISNMGGKMIMALTFEEVFRKINDKLSNANAMDLLDDVYIEEIIKLESIYKNNGKEYIKK